MRATVAPEPLVSKRDWSDRGVEAGPGAHKGRNSREIPVDSNADRAVRQGEA